MWLKMYMRVTGKDQGAIVGDCAQEGRQKMILCYGMAHDLELARDARGGLPAASAVHHPFTVTTHPGVHTPGIIRACCTAEPLEIEIRAYRVNRMGEEEPYLTIRLNNAVVADNRIRHREVQLEEHRAWEHVEDISFTYQTLTCLSEITKVETRQSWTGGLPSSP